MGRPEAVATPPSSHNHLANDMMNMDETMQKTKL
jgi:hypothetical protein